MDESNLFGGDQDLRTSTLVRHRPIQGQSNIDFLGESEGSFPQPHDSLPVAGEAMNDFWSMSGSFIYRHHVEPRVALYSPREESFPIPLKYIDVTRTTHTNLDVKLEKRIDDYWNIDGSRDLSDPWTGFTQFTLLDEKAPDGYTWSGGRLTRKQLTSRPDHLWPELWKSMGKNAKLKEKQKWSEEKIHLDNARKLRGIYFIDPEDKEFKETIKNARKKLETSVAPAMPCKIMKNCGSGGSDKNKTKLACILEANESTRMRMGNSEPHNHEDHIAGKGETSLQHYNLVRKFIPMPQAMKIPAAKAAVDKEWEKLEKISAWNLTKVKSKKQVIKEAGNIEISEIVNAEPKWQCKFCLNHCNPGVIYCVCGRLMTTDSAENRKYISSTLDSFSIPSFYIRKDRPRGHRYGKAPGCKEYHTANQLAKKCRKREYVSIHDRYIRDKGFRKAMIDIGRTEQMIIEMDKLAKEDHSYKASKEEIEFYRGNWWIHSNVARVDSIPTRYEPEFKSALSTMQRLKRAEDKKKQEATAQTSSSSSSWHWHSTWWESDYEHSPQKWYDH